MVTDAITNGKDGNYFNKITVGSSVFLPNSDVQIHIRNQQTLSLINEGSGVLEYSFNGQTLHGDMTPGTPSAAIFFDNRRVSRIWFRLKSGSASTIRIEAWSAL